MVLVVVGGTPSLLRDRRLRTLKLRCVCVGVSDVCVAAAKLCGFDAGGGGGVGGWLGRAVAPLSVALASAVVLQ